MRLHMVDVLASRVFDENWAGLTRIELGGWAFRCQMRVSKHDPVIRF